MRFFLASLYFFIPTLCFASCDGILFAGNTIVGDLEGGVLRTTEVRPFSEITDLSPEMPNLVLVDSEFVKNADPSLLIRLESKRDDLDDNSYNMEAPVKHWDQDNLHYFPVVDVEASILSLVEDGELNNATIETLISVTYSLYVGEELKCSENVEYAPLN